MKADVPHQQNAPKSSACTTAIKQTRAGLAAVEAAILVSGGNYDDCLTADEIDRLTMPIISSDRLLSAMELYLVRTGQSSSQSLIERLRGMLSTCGSSVIAPLHVRHHWTTAVFTTKAGQVDAMVLDSAPSPITAKDIRHLLLKQLTVRAVEIVSPGRQPHGSNECGVHAIVNAWRAFYALEPRIAEGELSLQHLRGVFAEFAQTPALTTRFARKIATEPRDEIPRQLYSAAEVVTAGQLALPVSKPSTSKLRPDAPPFLPRPVSGATLATTGQAHQAPSNAPDETEPAPRERQPAGGAPKRLPPSTIVATERAAHSHPGATNFWGAEPARREHPVAGGAPPRPPPPANVGDGGKYGGAQLMLSVRYPPRCRCIDQYAGRAAQASRHLGVGGEEVEIPR